jgi:predicted acyl esterase
VVRASLAALAVAVLLLAPTASPTSAFFKEDVTIPMDDGAKIAATIYRPNGEPPAGGWPAIVFMHALGGTRQQMSALVESSGFAGRDYVILTFDARGHGESTGLVSIDGPREIADVRAVERWLSDLGEVADREIGAWGISYGGGAALDSLVAGVPWAAVAAVQTWTDLYAALAPQNLVKSGLVAGLTALIPDDRKSPELKQVQAFALSGGHRGALVKWAAERSSLSRLASVRTPVFLAQGRRDFLFGIGQGIAALAELKGPRALYLGLHGHPPSTFPAADTGVLLTKTHAWFDCYLRHKSCNAVPKRFGIGPEHFGGTIVESSGLPATSNARFSFAGAKVIERPGKFVRTTPRLPAALETFGAPSVRLRVTPRKGWSRIVAVLSALTPSGEVVVGAGGVPLSGSRARAVTIRLSDQVTFVPKGSRLRLTLGSSSLAQSPANLLYLDLPMPPGASAKLGSATLTLPRLKTPVTK